MQLLRLAVNTSIHFVKGAGCCLWDIYTRHTAAVTAYDTQHTATPPGGEGRQIADADFEGRHFWRLVADADASREDRGQRTERDQRSEIGNVL